MNRIEDFNSPSAIRHLLSAIRYPPSAICHLLSAIRHLQTTMLDTELNHLETSELVRRLNDPELAYLFQHTLIQETTRSTLLDRERRRLNLLVGQTLEELFPERTRDVAALLARHYAEARDAAKTIEYAELAGDLEAQIGASAEALEHYTLALQTARQSKAPAAKLQDLFLKRGRMLEVTNAYTAALENYDELARVGAGQQDRSLELAAMMASATIYSIPSVAYNPARAQELTNAALELARELHDNAAQAKILWNLMLANSRVGRGFRVALQYGMEALEIARANHLREREAYLLNDISPLLYFRGQPELGSEYNLQAREMWREFGNLPMLSGNYGYAAMMNLIVGELDTSIEASAEGMALSQKINNEWNQAFALSWVGGAFRERGEIARALDTMEQAIALGARAFPPTLVLTRSDLADLHADLGALAQSIELGELALAAAERFFPNMLPKARGALAHASILRGDLKRARELLRDAPPVREFVDNPLVISGSARAQVELALAERDYNRALTLGNDFVEFVRHNQLWLFLPAALHGLALTRMARGEWEQAPAALDEAREVADKMNARWSLLQNQLTRRTVELARGDSVAAEQSRAQARELVAYIAARTPEPLRSSFMNLPQILELG